MFEHSRSTQNLSYSSTKDTKGSDIFDYKVFVLFAAFVVKFAFPFLVAVRGIRSLVVDVPLQETRKSLH